ncbi:MAG: DUF3617 family protein [Dissulfurispiraceae bacterium]|jgi:hypothetical protein|nr:DUF3617 family protein [Dissulfurispiraceae bacterium]
MKRIFLMLAVLCFIFTFAGCGSSSAGPDIKDGLWEITTTTDMPGMPAGLMQPFTHTTCLSKKDYVPKNEQDTSCKVEKSEVKGSTVTWKVVCSTGTSSGRITYSGSSFDGATETAIKAEGKDMKINSTMKGKYLGPCKQ